MRNLWHNCVKTCEEFEPLYIFPYNIPMTHSLFPNYFGSFCCNVSIMCGSCVIAESLNLQRCLTYYDMKCCLAVYTPPVSDFCGFCKQLKMELILLSIWGTLPVIYCIESACNLFYCILLYCIVS